MEDHKNKVDYLKLGFMSGLEIHQQLETNKLFCKCPSYLRSEEPDFIIKRRLHRIAGESGKVDVAVEHEASLTNNEKDGYRWFKY